MCTSHVGIGIQKGILSEIKISNLAQKITTENNTRA
jgi:hypothetical protein